MDRDKTRAERDRALCRRLINDEEAAFKELITRTEKIVIGQMNYDYFNSSLEHMVNDVIQEVILRFDVVINLRPDADHNINALLSVMARGRWIDEIRRRSAWQKFKEAYKSILPETHLGGFDKRESEEEARYLFPKIKSLIEKHYPKCYLLLMMRFQLNMTNAEIGEVLGKSKERVAVDIHNCLKRINKLVKKYKK